MLSALLLAAALQFVSPVHDDHVTLAGNFGEPRPHHFHGGIDVRTGMVVGKPLFAIADGYVSRITVGLFGFGNAVFIQHPDGHSSVYCHLKDFTPVQRARISRYRREHGQPDDIAEWHKPPQNPADIYLRPHEMPVSRGQLVAISGNTGSSVAPHLHLEIHDTRTWAMRDPLSYVGQYLVDKTPPQAHAFMAYPQEGEGIFNGSGRQQYFNFTSHDLQREFTAWGKVGFGIWANDYMEDTFHHYGIRHTRLTIDGEVIFESDVDSIPAQMNRQVNSWGDYLHWRHQNVWYMKSFVEPGCQLPLFKTNDTRGIYDFNREKYYQVVYALTDAYGNQSLYSFTVTGKRQSIPRTPRKNLRWMLRWDQTNHLQLPGMQLTLGRHQIAVDTEVQPVVSLQPGQLSHAYTIAQQSTPTFRDVEISIRLNRPVSDTARLCIAAGEREYPATYRNGWVTAKIRELGASYQVRLSKGDKNQRFIQ